MKKKSKLWVRSAATVSGLSALALGFVACGGGDSTIVNTDDSGADGTTDTGPTPDTGTDAKKDSAADTGADVAKDAPVDTGTDTGVDAGTDTGTDTGIDTGVADTGVDTGILDTGIDTGLFDAALPVCGNAIREAGEQCDDGNVTNLDGCNSVCRFEQSTRATSLKVQFATDAFCAQNAIGGAIADTTAQGQLQGIVDSSVKNGTINFLLTYLDIKTLTGTGGPTNVGSVIGAPVPYPNPPSMGNADLDWWYNVDATTLNASRNPTAKLLPGSFTGSVLNASGGHLWLAFIGAANLDLANSKIRLPIGASSVPLTSAGTPPGHTASENLDPTLQSFAQAGGVFTAPTGQLCGNATAVSMANASIPGQLVQGGANACIENYTANNSLLDLFVGGCKVFGGFITFIAPTQPDSIDPDAPAAGTGAPYTLTANGQRNVTACTDSASATVPLANCLAAAAYSGSFKLSVDRVILK